MVSIGRGQVRLEGNSVLVKFPYDKARYSSIKKLKEARYSKDRKSWILPVEQLVSLMQLTGFEPHQISYTFNIDQAEEALKESAALRDGAWQRIKTNPFSVTPEDILTVNPELVVRLDRSKSGLRGFIKSRSPAKKLLTAIDQVHYIRSEASYFLPVEALTPLLKTLRDSKLSFAIEASAGEQLVRTAESRSSVLGGDQALSFLENSLVAPFVCPTSSDTFTLKGSTPEQRKLLKTGLRPAVAKRLTSNFAFQDLLTVLYRAKVAQIKIWLPTEISDFIANSFEAIEQEFFDNFDCFDDGLIYVVEPEVCLIHDSVLGFGALCSDKFDAKDISKVAKLIPFPGFENYHFIEFSEETYKQAQESIYEQVGKPVAKAKSYINYIEELERRAASLARRAHYLEQTDWNRWLVNSELEDRLFPHQRIAVAWLHENSYGMLGDDMGLGKTLSVLACYDQLLSTDDIDFLLVVCPNSLVKNWVREARDWIPGHSLEFLPETKAAKIQFLENEQLFSDAKGLVINYENLRLEYILPSILKLAENNRVMLVVDESQRVKNHQSKTFIALRELAAKCKRRILLSGTPTPKDITDVWSQMYLIDLGERFGLSYYKWLETVAELGTKWSEYAVKSFSPEGIKRTVSRVHEVLLRRSKEDVVDLPDKMFSVRDIELTGDQKKRYEEIRKELLLRVRSASGDTFVREIDSLLEQYLRAVQIASNPRIIDPEWEGQPAKFIELDLLVEELVAEQGRKVVIWTNYLTNVDELVERYKKFNAKAFSGQVSKADREETVNEFQSSNTDSCKVLVAVPAAGGVGITLTAAQTAIYLDKTWNAEHWMQSIDRIHRIGQTGFVNIISLHASKVDEVIGRNLYNKQKQQAEILGDKELVYEFVRPTREELLEAVSA